MVDTIDLEPRIDLENMEPSTTQCQKPLAMDTSVTLIPPS